MGAAARPFGRLAPQRADQLPEATESGNEPWAVRGETVRLRGRARPVTADVARRGTTAVLSAALLLVGSAACGGEAATPREGVSAEELSGDVSGNVDLSTAPVAGRISLRGTIVRVLSKDSFELRPADGATDDPVLVLNREDELTDGQVVQVIGTVRLFSHDEHTGEYELADPSAYGRHDGDRFVLAEEVDTDVPGDDQ